MRTLRLKGRLILPDLNMIVANGANVHVEPKAMEVLLQLVRHAGEVVSRTGLLQSVWGGRFVCDDVVTNAISLLRRALGDASGRFLIETVPKRGYRLMFPVTEEATSGPQAGDLERLILRARYLRHEETPASLKSACAYCEEIIRQEPNCAAAYAELSLSLFLLEKLGAASRQEIEPKVRSAVDSALRLDERAPMTLACLAKQEYRYDWKWDQAERHFRQALQAGPADADVFSEFSILLSVLRRFDEGLSCIRSACTLDPMSPAVRLQAGHANYASGEWETAALYYRRVLRCNPEHVFARWGLADTLSRSGRPNEAITTLNEGLQIEGAGPNPLLLTALSRTKANLENAKQPVGCEDLLRTNDPVLLAEVYGQLGDLKRAFALLDQAVDLRHYRLSAVNMFPQFEPIRADQRYQRLCKRVGLCH